MRYKKIESSCLSRYIVLNYYKYHDNNKNSSPYCQCEDQKFGKREYRRRKGKFVTRFASMFILSWRESRR